MPNRKKVLKGLECAIGIRGRKDCDNCPYDFNCLGCEIVMHDAIALLKEQEPRPVTADDFKNADTWGWIPAWCEEKDGSSYWEMITIGALEETRYQYWTARPTEEQKKAVKWDED